MVAAMVIGGFFGWKKYLADQQQWTTDIDEIVDIYQKQEEKIDKLTVDYQKQETKSGQAADWKEYTDSEAGFTLKHSTDVTIGDLDPKANKLILNISSQKVDSLTLPGDYDKEKAEKDGQELDQGKFGEDIGWALDRSKKVVKIGDKYTKSFVTLGRLEVCDVTFERGLIFYNGDYQVRITLSGPKDDIIASMPGYFKTDTDNCGEEKVWGEPDKFHEALMSGAGSTVAQDWYYAFDKIVKTIEVK